MDLQPGRQPLLPEPPLGVRRPPVGLVYFPEQQGGSPGVYHAGAQRFHMAPYLVLSHFNHMTSLSDSSLVYCLQQVYRQHVLEKALLTLVSPGRRVGDACDAEPSRRTQTGDALSYSQLLTENATAAVSPCNDSSSSLLGPSTIQGLGVGDEVAGWWAAVVAVASYWLLSEEDKAEQLHSRVEAFPKSLDGKASQPLGHGDPLLEAVLGAYR